MNCWFSIENFFLNFTDNRYKTHFSSSWYSLMASYLYIEYTIMYILIKIYIFKFFKTLHNPLLQTLLSSRQPKRQLTRDRFGVSSTNGINELKNRQETNLTFSRSYDLTWGVVPPPHPTTHVFSCEILNILILYPFLINKMF